MEKCKFIFTLFFLFQEDEEPLEPDELPEHLRPQPQIDFNKVCIGYFFIMYLSRLCLILLFFIDQRHRSRRFDEVNEKRSHVDDICKSIG